MSPARLMFISAMALCLLTLAVLPFSLQAEAQPKPAEATPSADGAAYHNAAWNPAVSATVRKKLYLFTSEFPSDPMVQYPSPRGEETRFWQLLDKDMAATDSLSLTADPTQADYRVELRCGGVFNCSRLLVDVKDPHRKVLTSFSLDRINHYRGLGSARLEQVSQELSRRLDERIRLLPQGGYGQF